MTKIAYKRATKIGARPDILFKAFENSIKTRGSDMVCFIREDWF